jgi:hypothetical protein
MHFGKFEMYDPDQRDRRGRRRRDRTMHPLLERLKGGDLRSIGRSEEVVQTVLARPGLFAILMSGLTSEDELVRMRAADAAEKVTARKPEWLAPYKKVLVDEIAHIDQQEVRWHAAILFTRLELTKIERRKVITILRGWMEDKSRIVQTFSLQALANLSKQDPRLRSGIRRLIEEKAGAGFPSVRSRAKKLLKELDHDQGI